jgi:hypothetical protein
VVCHLVAKKEGGVVKEKGGVAKMRKRVAKSAKLLAKKNVSFEEQTPEIPEAIQAGIAALLS